MKNDTHGSVSFVRTNCEYEDASVDCFKGSQHAIT